MTTRRFDLHLLVLLTGPLAGCSPSAAPAAGETTEPSDAVIERSDVDRQEEGTSRVLRDVDSSQRSAVANENELKAEEYAASTRERGPRNSDVAARHGPARTGAAPQEAERWVATATVGQTGNEPNDEEQNEHSALTVEQHGARHDVAAPPGAVRTPPAPHQAERRVASATGRRHGMRYRFVVLEGVDPDLDASGSGYPVPYRRSELQVRDGDRWVAIYQDHREPLSDLLCRIPQRYTLEVLDERRPLLLLHARWRWTECGAGMAIAGPSWEEGTFVIVRDDGGAVRWSEFRTRLVLADRLLLDEVDDGRETWSWVRRVNERGELRVRADGYLRYSWDGHPARVPSTQREMQLFGPHANATWSGDVLW